MEVIGITGAVILAACVIGAGGSAVRAIAQMRMARAMEKKALRRIVQDEIQRKLDDSEWEKTPISPEVIGDIVDGKEATTK